MNSEVNDNLDNKTRSYLHATDAGLKTLSREDILIEANKSIYRFLRKQGLSHQDAEDLAQDCCVMLQNGGLEKWNESSRFSSFLFAIAKRKLWSFWRKERKRRAVPMTISQDDDEKGLFIGDIPAPVAPEMFEADRIEDRNNWERFLQSLESRCDSPAEKDAFRSLRAKVTIPSDEGSVVDDPGWDPQTITSHDKALCYRLLARLNNDPRSGAANDTSSNQGSSDLRFQMEVPDSTVLRGARLRAEIWRYWADRAAAK